MSLMKHRMIEAHEALSGSETPVRTDAQHFVLKTPLKGPYPEGSASIVVAMGCFWGVERLFWSLEGVFVTAAGYVGGFTQNPTYEQVCSGATGHTEGVLIVYDPQKLKVEDILRIFWEKHDPTQGLRQGNDIGSQYRSAIFCADATQYEAALRTRAAFQAALIAKGFGTITTDIFMQSPFYFAEDYHQAYLAKNPDGYCGIKGTGAVCVV